VLVTLPDGQEIRPRLLARRQEADGSWWYVCELTLWTDVDAGGRHRAEPGPVVFAAPASACQPVDGESYHEVPTESVRQRPPFAIERRGHGTVRLIVHRGDCHAGPGPRIGVRYHQAWTTLHQDGGEACPICHPNTALPART
jgi:hypothetical protein